MRKESWHLDKKFSIGIIGAILFQCGTFIWYASQVNFKVNQTAEQVTAINSWRDKKDDSQSKIETHLAVVDEKLNQQTDILKHVVDMLEKSQFKPR